MAHIEEVVRENRVKSPAVIAVGKVCSLSDRFDWFGNLSLKGKRILVTQPKSKASRLEGKLRALGAETGLYPCIRTEFIRPMNPPFTAYDTCVFTSTEGVHSFFNWLFEQGKDVQGSFRKEICLHRQRKRQKRLRITDFVRILCRVFLTERLWEKKWYRKALLLLKTR